MTTTSSILDMPLAQMDYSMLALSSMTECLWEADFVIH